MAIFDIFRKKQEQPQLQEEQQREQQELTAGLEKTKTGLFSKLARAVAGRSTVDADVLDELEEVLITSDVGVETTVKIIRRIEERAARDKYMNANELQHILHEEIAALMEEAHGSEETFGLDARAGPQVISMNSYYWGHILHISYVLHLKMPVELKLCNSQQHNHFPNNSD